MKKQIIFQVLCNFFFRRNLFLPPCPATKGSYNPPQSFRDSFFRRKARFNATKGFYGPLRSFRGRTGSGPCTIAGRILAGLLENGPGI